MARDDIERQVQEAARSFDAELHTRAFVETHSDAAQLAWMLSFLRPAPNQVILDLGTGNGYVASAVARQEPDCRVVGVDVAAQAIERNREQAREEGRSNVEFLIYDGIRLPFPDDHFDAAVSRYVFHHLPRLEISLEELARTVREKGTLVLADAIRHEGDDVDFINRFQLLKRDGHIRMHQRADFIDVVCRHGFRLVETFDSSISFTRERGADYDALIAKTPDSVLSAYAMRIDEQKMAVTFPILSAVFENLNSGP
ncbi:MAG: methyltransferase domain-containing protein [Gammaproteobacteria bacterium]|nr:methyltransferase domain-containing protein [Gammaproteobacteria bacterium]NIM72734.1 methyltransferase domain-containing protein [Gammaproteobacteria bacterium]NIN38191.1 methyltransferase domain-containing protein [Gammaproteobacteria bacterium]NIO24482.1 methyltransferase domain-containing protein [Gammaproteobacteria bacterium]NIO65091.1 methyltransferase domain-containing protein [Gammaproteobacteria bacterium]